MIKTWDKNPFVCTSTDLSVHYTDSLSVNSSLSAANSSKFLRNYGEKNAVNYLHENLVKSPTISISYVTSVVAPVWASSIQPVHSSCDTSVVAPIHALSIQPVRTSHITSVFAPVCASPIPSIHTYDDERQEFPDGDPGTEYGEKTPSEITVKFPHDITLTLQQVKFLKETPDTTKRVIYPCNFMVT